jgi:hypothetical protein
MCAWVRIEDKLHDNDKLGGVSDGAFRLWVLALSWSNDKLTDGHIPTSRPLKLLVLRNEKKTIAELLEAKLWHRAASPCRSCEQQRKDKHGDVLPTSGYVIHDYFVYQRTAWVIRAERDKNMRAGRRSGQVRREQSVEQGVQGDERNGEHSVERSVEQSVERSVEQSVEHNPPKSALSVERSVEPRTPVPPVPRSTKYEVPDEPAIPDEPEATDRKRSGTTGKGDLRHISTSLKRAAR